jgi:hypothetical protein
MCHATDNFDFGTRFMKNNNTDSLLSLLEINIREATVSYFPFVFVASNQPLSELWDSRALRLDQLLKNLKIVGYPQLERQLRQTDFFFPRQPICCVCI